MSESFQNLKSGKSVELDFRGVKLFASPFFNGAIGQLLKDFSSDDLNRLVRISNLSSNGKVVMKKVIENAKTYYSSPDVQRAVDSAVQKEGEEN